MEINHIPILIWCAVGVCSTKCREDMEESCALALNKVVECVMSSLLELFESSRLQFFLLDSTNDSDFLNRDYHFAINEVEKYLSASHWEKVLPSLTGRGVMQPSKLMALTKIAHWYNLFSLQYVTVLHYLQEVSKDLKRLGLHLKIHPSVLEAIETDFPSQCAKRREQIVKKWMSSTHPPPCWWYLTKALREIGMGGLAKRIEREQGRSGIPFIANHTHLVNPFPL